MSSDAFILQGTIDVDVKDAVDSLNKVDKNVEKSGNAIEDMSSKSSKFGKIIASAFAVKEISSFGVECLNAASTVEEMENKFNVVFKSTSDSMDKWAKSYADAIGRSKTEIKTAISNQADLMIGMGMTEEVAGDLSQKYTELAYDLASFNNVNDATALEAMTKAMFGETEMAKQLGLNLNVTTMQNSEYIKSLGKSWDSLTQAEKAEAYYQEALKQSVNAIGDAERSSNSYANQIRRTKAKITEFTETLGTYFLPMETKVVTFFGNMIDSAINFVTKIADGLGKAKQEFEDTGEYVNWFATFWETVFGIEMPQSFYNMVDGIITFFYFLWDSIKQAVTTIATPTIQLIQDIFSGLKNHSDEIFNAIGDFFYNMSFVIESVWQNIGQPVFDLIVQVIGWVRDAFAERMPQIKAFFSGFVTDASNLWNNNLKPCLEAIGNFISNVLAPAFKTVFQGIILPIVDACFRGISDLWSNSLKPILTGIIDFITGVFSGNWSKAWQGVVDMLGGIFGGIVSVVKAPINAVIGLINSAISGLNSISVNIPDWVPGVGGKTFGVNIPEMSYLENGGILTEPTLIGYGVMAGEKNKGKNGQAEAVIPLTRMFDEVHQLGSNIANITANRSVPILADIYMILKDIKNKEAVSQTIYEFKGNNFDARETKETLSQIRFAASF